MSETDGIFLVLCIPCREAIFDSRRPRKIPATLPLPDDLCDECDAKIAQAVRILLSGYKMVKAKQP